MIKYLLLFSTFISFSQEQKFIPLDNETLEFVSEVNYTLYKAKKPVISSFTSRDSITKLSNEIDFDSIVFSKMNYKKIGLKKDNLKEVVLLQKETYELDEVVVTNLKPKETLIGEVSRFVKQKSRTLSKNPDFGVLFHESDLKKIELKKLVFFVEKVNYKTSYKIKFYSANETGNFLTRQYLKLDKLLFESPVLTLDKGIKNKVEINLDDYNINLDNNDVFICIELQDYFDNNNIHIKPVIKEETRIKFQLSKLTNYYAKMYDTSTNKLNDDIVNINALINYDFAHMFFKKPHKSNLVSPAILLYGKKIN